MDKDINYDNIYNGKKSETLSMSNDREIIKYAK
jgi:hypothetical protein